MAILRRMDGVQFSAQPYRSVLESKKSSLLNQEVRFLAQEHGNFVKLLRVANNQYSAIFSQDPGFLFGETVWQHFERPDNLVYCELFDKTQALLVVVNAGKVVIDGKFELANIVAQLNAVISETSKYKVFTSGKVPITSNSAENAYHFHDQNLMSYNHLPEPLFNTLHITEQYQLLPLQLALKEHRLDQSFKLPVIFTTILIIIAVSAWLLISYIQ